MKTFPWGSVQLESEDETFWYGFRLGRQEYFIRHREPIQVLAVTKVLDQVLERDEQKHYQMDRGVIKTPMFYVGALMGYLSGPLVPETPEEWQERQPKPDARRSPADPSAISLFWDMVDGRERG